MENCINCREQISAFLDDRLADCDRLALMEHWQQHKERSVAEAMGLRQQSIFLQMFADIAAYAQKEENSQWDLMDIGSILSDRSYWLR